MQLCRRRSRRDRTRRRRQESPGGEQQVERRASCGAARERSSMRVRDVFSAASLRAASACWSHGVACSRSKVLHAAARSVDASSARPCEASHSPEFKLGDGGPERESELAEARCCRLQLPLGLVALVAVCAEQPCSQTLSLPLQVAGNGTRRTCSGSRRSAARPARDRRARRQPRSR